MVNPVVWFVRAVVNRRSRSVAKSAYCSTELRNFTDICMVEGTNPPLFPLLSFVWSQLTWCYTDSDPLACKRVGWGEPCGTQVRKWIPEERKDCSVQRWYITLTFMACKVIPLYYFAHHLLRVTLWYLRCRRSFSPVAWREATNGPFVVQTVFLNFLQIFRLAVAFARLKNAK